MYGFNQWKGGYGMGFGKGRGNGNRMGNGFGLGYGRRGGFGRGFNNYADEFPVMDELEMLKRYKERLELHRRDLDSELIAVEKRIAELQK